MAKPDSKTEEEEPVTPPPPPPPDPEPKVEPEPRRAPMDEVLTNRLGKVAAALDDGALLVELKDEPRKTPESWEQVATRRSPGPTKGAIFHQPGHLVALLVANAYVDAYLLECPGTSRDHAVILVQGLLDAQREHGMRKCTAADDPGGEGAAAWDAAMAAILYTAFVAGPAPIREEAATWWRQDIDQQPLGPIAEFILHGKRAKSPNLAAQFFYHMENVALPKPARPWKVVA